MSDPPAKAKRILPLSLAQQEQDDTGSTDRYVGQGDADREPSSNWKSCSTMSVFPSSGTWSATGQALDVGIGTKKNYWVTKGDLTHAREWYARGFTNAMKTPDDTLIFVSPEEEKQIRVDQAECMGCLSQCGFSSWADNEKNSTGRLADPRSFCIQKTLQEIAHGGPVEQNLMFAGHAAFRFKSDPFYSNGFIPTVKQLVDRILTGA